MKGIKVKEILKEINEEISDEVKVSRLIINIVGESFSSTLLTSPPYKKFRFSKSKNKKEGGLNNDLS